MSKIALAWVFVLSFCAQGCASDTDETTDVPAPPVNVVQAPARPAEALSQASLGGFAAGAAGGATGTPRDAASGLATGKR